MEVSSERAGTLISQRANLQAVYMFKLQVLIDSKLGLNSEPRGLLGMKIYVGFGWL